MKKILLIIIDGLGDEPIPQLGKRTPLESANTPNLDFLAENGACGYVLPKLSNTLPTSEETHFALLGYNPEFYKIRRGIITATGAGMKVKKGDIALRGNFATVDEKLNIIDRRAGRIKNPEALIKALNGIEIKGVKFLLKSATEHRLGIIIRALPNFEKISGGQGKNLSSNISDGDPHYGKLGKRARKIKALDKSKEAVFTAKVLNEFLEKAHQILKIHAQNKKRKKLGLSAANYILVRGASTIPELPSFKEKYGLRAACIAGKFLYKQIGKILGMTQIKVRGATGLPSTNLKGKFEAAQKALKKYDFVFLHIKAADSLAEDGDFLAKKEFIEEIDKNIPLGIFFANAQNIKQLIGLKDTLIVVTCDHSTCSLLKRHCKEPCPILIYPPKFFGKKLRRASSVKEFTRLSFAKQRLGGFSERACKEGQLGKIKQIDLMPKVLGFAKR